MRVGNAVLGVPAAEGGNLVRLRENLPIEVKFSRWNAGDGVPYGRIVTAQKAGRNCFLPAGVMDQEIL